MTTATLTRPAAAPSALYARGLTGAAADLLVRHEDGSAHPVPLAAWLGAPTADDLRLLARVDGPVLDIGCGPGRHVAALARRAVTALGVDVSPVAVGTTRARGGAAYAGCIFAPVPAAGRWRTAMLLDGNIGIGGSPRALLRRAAQLVTADGHILVELDPPGALTGAGKIRLEDGEDASAWFPWAHVAADDVAAIARGAGLRVSDDFTEGDRWFADLVRA